MSLEKRRLVMKSFITSQFGYCPVVWMFHSRTLNNRINAIHERALRIVYKNYNSTFDELLVCDNSVRVHYRNLQQLAIEIFKFKNNLSPEIMNNVFEAKEESYNLRNATGLKRVGAKTVRYGTETVRFIAPKLWNMIPDAIKSSNSINHFKSQIKKWKPSNCSCRLCKIYVQNVGFI